MKKILIILLFIASPKQTEKIERLSWYNLQELLEDDKLTYKIIIKNDHPIWNKIDNESYFYFVHSYFVKPSENNYVLGETNHGEIFSSVIAKDNIIAIQGHPEKSSSTGLQFLKNFIGM